MPCQVFSAPILFLVTPYGCTRRLPRWVHFTDITSQNLKATVIKVNSRSFAYKNIVLQREGGGGHGGGAEVIIPISLSAFVPGGISFSHPSSSVYLKVPIES